MCATKIGMNACSDTSNMTVNMCMMSLGMYRGGTLAMAMTIGKYVIFLWCIFAGICVSLYHVSACRSGFQQMALLFGPNAMHLATSHAHMDADNTKNILIYGICVSLNMLFDLEYVIF